MSIVPSCLALASAIVGAMPAVAAAAPIAAGSVTPAARDGLQRFLTLNEHVESAQEAPGCPLLEVDELKAALDAMPFEDPLLGVNFQLADDHHRDDADTRRVECTGVVGADDDFAPPSVEIVVSVADLGDQPTVDEFLLAEGVDVDDPAEQGSAGETAGACRVVDERTACSEWWSAEGFVVGATVSGADGVERPETAAILDQLAPSILDRLAGWAGEPTPDAELSAEQLQRSATAIETFVGEHPPAALNPERALDCLALDRDGMAAALDSAELAAQIQDWAVIFTESAPSSSGGRWNLLCAGDDNELTVSPLPGFGPGASMSVVGFESPAAANDYVDANDIVVSAELLPVSGHLTVGNCLDSGGLRTCEGRWWQGGVMISLSVTADPEMVDLQRTEAALLDAVPTAVSTLSRSPNLRSQPDRWVNS